MTNRARLLAPIALLVALAALWSRLPIAELLDTFRTRVAGLGALGVVAFVALHVALMVGLGPVSALTLSAGLIWGAWGFPLAVGATTLGCAVAFLIGRYLARARVERHLARDARLRALDRALAREGWKPVGLLRLTPLFPYGLQNYLLSISAVGFVPFVLATALGVLPPTALYVYLGALGRTVEEGGTLRWAVAALGIAATALVAWLIARRLRDALGVGDEER